MRLELKRLVGSLTAFAVSIVFLPSVHAALASWTFTSGGSTPFPADTPIDTFLSSASLAVVSPNGGTISAPTSGGQSGGYLQIAGSGVQVNGSTLTFTLTASGGTVTVNSLTFYYNRKSQSPTLITWTPSFGTSTATTTLGGSGWSVQQTVNFNNVVIYSGSTFTLTGSLSGGGNGTGDIGFDTISFLGTSVVPEPVHYALAALGFLFISVRASRYCLARLRRA